MRSRPQRVLHLQGLLFIAIQSTLPLGSKSFSQVAMSLGGGSSGGGGSSSSSSSRNENPFAQFRMAARKRSSEDSGRDYGGGIPGGGGGEPLKRRPMASKVGRRSGSSSCCESGTNKAKEASSSPASSSSRGTNRPLPDHEYDESGQVLAFVGKGPNAFRERWSSTCRECFEKSVRCPHHAEVPLRLLILGHNPSELAWKTGISYGNPSNRFWSLLRESGTLPSDWRVNDTRAVWNNLAPSELGIGFTDIGLFVGSDAQEFSAETMRQWSKDFYVRSRAHSKRCGADPLIVAFTGKRHFAMLFTPTLKRVDSFGRQTRRPPDWPFGPDSEIWVMPSPSGRAAMTSEERLKPYVELARRLSELPNPASQT